jgi:FkbM family methyltransferase
MLIPFEEVFNYIQSLGHRITGILHVGAHECEEKYDYNRFGISDQSIYWVEGNEEKVQKMKQKGIPNLYHALVDEVEHDVEFYITNNGQSSSLLPLDTHAKHYPQIVVVQTIPMKTTTLKSLIEKESIPISKCNFWNFDIQGAELLALKGAGDCIQSADFIYLEVNIETLYKECALLSDLDQYLGSQGFVRVTVKLTEAGWGDALYVRSSKLFQQ